MLAAAVIAVTSLAQSSDNSLYKNSKENGHIELEKHLENGNFEASSGIYDKDPKLSGKVKIQGTVNDNKILKDIRVKHHFLYNYIYLHNYKFLFYM